jgi:hypothetical protein
MTVGVRPERGSSPSKAPEEEGRMEGALGIVMVVGGCVLAWLGGLPALVAGVGGG